MVYLHIQTKLQVILHTARCLNLISSDARPVRPHVQREGVGMDISNKNPTIMWQLSDRHRCLPPTYIANISLYKEGEGQYLNCTSILKRTFLGDEAFHSLLCAQRLL